jgi:membrane protease YdiL (CAAX protease family)
MLARVMSAGIATPDWRRGFIRATQVGCATALLGLLVASVLSYLIPEGPGSLAGDGLFQQSGLLGLMFAALVWAPLFETVFGQTLPIAFVRLFTKAELPAVLGSGLVFSLGHMASGGDAMQGALTMVIGSIFASVYVANIESGAVKASILTAWAHCIHNAITFGVAMHLP